MCEIRWHRNGGVVSAGEGRRRQPRRTHEGEDLVDTRKQLWTDNDGAAGAPIIADGLVWTIGTDNAVHGLSPANGKQVVSIPFGGSANHFPTPSAADGLLLLPGINQVFAFMGPAGLPSAPLTS